MWPAALFEVLALDPTNANQAFHLCEVDQLLSDQSGKYYSLNCPSAGHLKSL